MKATDFYSTLRSTCLGEFQDSEKNEAVLYIEFDEEKQCINVGTASNCGIITYFSVDYDSDFSIDENLQNVLDAVYDNGFSDIED